MSRNRDWKRRTAKDPKYRAKRAWSRKKHQCKREGIPFDLLPEDFLAPAVCPVLGLPLKMSDGWALADDTPSVDRIDPALGYVRNNIIVVSLLANKIKSSATPEQLLAVAKFYLQLTKRRKKNEKTKR